ncbi:MAG: lytic transglycosylase domain-containing protein, partial [Oxalobacteraceae bacterium]
KEASSIGDSTGRATICSRSPAHEPYHHPINATVSTAPAGSGAGAGGAGTIKRADGTLVQGVTEPDNTPVQKIGGYKVSDRVNGCIYQASRRTGVPYTTMMAMAAAESSFNPNAGASSSSAKGLYQFVGGTWDTMQKRYGPNGTVVKNPGVSTNIFDPCGNALMGAYYIKENAAALSAAGLGTSPTELYCCHFLGTGGGRRFLRAVKANPNALSNQSVDGRAFRANRSIFVKQNGQTRTNQEVYNILHAKTGATVPQWAAYQKSHSTNK